MNSATGGSVEAELDAAVVACARGPLPRPLQTPEKNATTMQTISSTNATNTCRLVSAIS